MKDAKVIRLSENGRPNEVVVPRNNYIRDFVTGIILYRVFDLSQHIRGGTRIYAD